MNLQHKLKKKPKGLPNAELFEQYPRWTTHHKLIFLKLCGNDKIYFELLDRLEDKAVLYANFAISFCLVAKEIGIDKCLAVCNTYDFVRNSPIWKQKRGIYRKQFFEKLEQVKNRGVELAKLREMKMLDPSINLTKIKNKFVKPKDKVYVNAKPKPHKFQDALKTVNDVVIVRKKVIPK